MTYILVQYKAPLSFFPDMTMNWGAERCLQSAEVAKEDDRFEEKTYTLGVKDNQKNGL